MTWPWISSDLQHLVGFDRLQLVDNQFPIRGYRNRIMWQWPRRGAFELLSFRREFAAVAWARNHVRLGLPLRHAAEMRAHRGHGVKSAGSSHDVNLLLLQKRYRINRIEIGIPGPKRRGWLEQNVG